MANHNPDTLAEAASFEARLPANYSQEEMSEVASVLFRWLDNMDAINWDNVPQHIFKEYGQ